MKKNVVNKALMTALLLMVLLVTGKAYAETIVKNEDIPIYLEIIDVFSKDEFHEIFKEEDYEVLKATGRDIVFGEEEVTLIYRGRPSPKNKGDINLFMGGREIPVNTDGTISLPMQARKHGANVLSLDNEGFICSVPSFIKSNEREIVFRLSSEHILECMQSKEEIARAEMKRIGKANELKGYGDRYRPGDWVHCNRFNGPLTDDIHYDKKTNLNLALRNFYGSDCEASVKNFGPCVSFMHKFCNQPASGRTAAACSSLTRYESGTRCGTRYHKHSSPAVYYGK